MLQTDGFVRREPFDKHLLKKLYIEPLLINFSKNSLIRREAGYNHPAPQTICTTYQKQETQPTAMIGHILQTLRYF
ncbi:hypothetical protein CA233_22610 [Sphingomonas sp. ABOLD]|nr:hypothetical protein CA233_22610 [Sphingomonas sp. ABOLD]